MTLLAVYTLLNWDKLISSTVLETLAEIKKNSTYFYVTGSSGHFAEINFQQLKLRGKSGSLGRKFLEQAKYSAVLCFHRSWKALLLKRRFSSVPCTAA